MDQEQRIKRSLKEYFRLCQLNVYQKSKGLLVIFRMQTVHAPEGFYFTHFYNTDNDCYSISFISWQSIREKKGMKVILGSPKFYQTIYSRTRLIK